MRRLAYFLGDVCRLTLEVFGRKKAAVTDSVAIPSDDFGIVHGDGC